MSVETWVKALTAFIPFLAGGLLLKWFKEWAYTEKEMADKVNQAKENITERLAEAHADLLEALNAGKPLRGKPPHTPDPAGRYSRNLRQKMSILYRFETAAMLSEAGHAVLFFTWLAALLVLLVGIIAAANQAVEWCERAFFSAIVLALVQAILVGWLRRLKKQVDVIGDTI